MQQLEKDIAYLYDIKARLSEITAFISPPPGSEFDQDKQLAASKGHEHAELLIRNLRAIQRYIRGDHDNRNK